MDYSKEKEFPKKTLSEKERLELAAKLDKDLDQFIDQLPRRAPLEENVPFSRWEEASQYFFWMYLFDKVVFFNQEITSHPFFMKNLPEPGSDIHPLYEGLQKLKYDPEENEPDELAIAYKDDGNFNFKHKNYRMAIISYTEGIKVKCANPEIECILHNNRSAAHFYLKNYRSALLDCELALKYKADYYKAQSRAAMCCHKLKKFDSALKYCDLILEKNKDDNEILSLKKCILEESKIEKRDKRKRQLAQNKIKQEEELIVGEILKRGIKVDSDSGILIFLKVIIEIYLFISLFFFYSANLSLSKLEPQFPELFNSRVHVNEKNDLVWPVIFFYPEYKIMDYIQHFNEQTT